MGNESSTQSSSEPGVHRSVPADNTPVCDQISNKDYDMKHGGGCGAYSEFIANTYRRCTRDEPHVVPKNETIDKLAPKIDPSRQERIDRLGEDHDWGYSRRRVSTILNNATPDETKFDSWDDLARAIDDKGAVTVGLETDTRFWNQTNESPPYVGPPQKAKETKDATVPHALAAVGSERDDNGNVTALICHDSNSVSGGRRNRLRIDTSSNAEMLRRAEVASEAGSQLLQAHNNSMDEIETEISRRTKRFTSGPRGRSAGGKEFAARRMMILPRRSFGKDADARSCSKMHLTPSLGGDFDALMDITYL